MSETEGKSGATFCAPELEKMVKMQLNRSYDYFRMHQFWVRVLEGDTPAKEIATALCRTLSSGRYVEMPDAPRNIFNITVTGNATAEQVAEAVQASLLNCTLSR
ncbi:MAG: hypothetical protein ACTIBJ_15000 [Pseudomonas helleri]|uniref:hypothetical protein n=1 Tax=Pseudomonas helleri TaxID=1608996 RepID=UPI003F9BB0E6